jgi:hypothetical protein
MAGHQKSKPVADRSLVNQGTRRRKARNRKLYGEAMKLAAADGMTRPTGVTVTDVLQECLERATGGLRFAAAEVDKLKGDDFWVQKVDAQGNVLVEPNKWYQLEQACRAEVEELATKMLSLDIDSRLAAVEEARAMLMFRAVVEAAKKVGLDPATVRALGSALRGELEAIEGTALEAA